MPQLKLPAKIDNLDQMIDFIKDGAENFGFDKKSLSHIHLALEEIIVNVISYAYPDKEGDVFINYDFFDDGHVLQIEIIDEGIPFNPIERKTPDVNAPVEDRTIGGLGIYLVKQVMDELVYHRDDDKKNVLCMRKNKE